jgi:hypothetical protein
MTHAPRYRRRFRIQASIAVVHSGTAIRSVGESVRPIYFITVLTPDGEPGLQR